MAYMMPTSQVEFDMDSPYQCARVVSIRPGSAAANATPTGSISMGDVIVGVNGLFLLDSDLRSFTSAFSVQPPGGRIVLKLAPEEQVRCGHLVCV